MAMMTTAIANGSRCPLKTWPNVEKARDRPTKAPTSQTNGTTRTLLGGNGVAWSYAK